MVENAEVQNQIIAMDTMFLGLLNLPLVRKCPKRPLVPLVQTCDILMNLALHVSSLFLSDAILKSLGSTLSLNHIHTNMHTFTHQNTHSYSYAHKHTHSHTNHKLILTQTYTLIYTQIQTLIYT